MSNGLQHDSFLTTCRAKSSGGSLIGIFSTKLTFKFKVNLSCCFQILELLYRAPDPEQMEIRVIVNGQPILIDNSLIWSLFWSS